MEKNYIIITGWKLNKRGRKIRFTKKVYFQ